MYPVLKMYMERFCRKHKMDLSISIASWNTKDYLRNCLKSIFDNTTDIDFEVLVVDNGSTDGSVDMVKKEFPQVCLIENERNLGYAGANNRALNKAKGRNIVIMNTDVVVMQNALEKMVCFLDANKNAGAVGCKLLGPDGKFAPAFIDNVPNLIDAFLDRILFIHSIKLYLIRKGPFQKMMLNKYSRPREVDWAGGSCLMVKREVIEQAGLMDEDYFMYSEDADWCYRIGKAGWKVFSLPSAQVIHYEDQSGKQCSAKMYKQRYVSELLFYKKHYPLWKVQLYRFIAVIGLSIRFMTWQMIYLLSPAKRDAAKNTVEAIQQSFKALSFDENRI